MTAPADFGSFGTAGRARRTWASLAIVPSREAPLERVALAPDLCAVRFVDTWSVWRRLSDNVTAELVDRDLPSVDAAREAA